MGRVLAAEAAELAQLEPLARLLPVLGRAVIAALALGARHRDDFSHALDPGPWPPASAVRRGPLSFDKLGNPPCADRSPALADGETRTFFDRDRRHQLGADRGVVTRHHHLDALGQMQRAGDVGRPDVELRAVAVEEWRVAATLLLRQDVHLALELRVRLDRARLAEHLASLDVVLFDSAEQDAGVVAGDAFVEQLPEHLDAGDDLLLGRL